ncbi:MAG: flagellar basal body L-ring protein FlgH [Deltaproteobacteria bacterium]|nr:flagellar basal body L-ring protein FlgH [Deltaproteobacteria bacterium]
MNVRILFLAMAVLFLAGCAGRQEPKLYDLTALNVKAKKPPPDAESRKAAAARIRKHTGSLWQDQGGALFKAHIASRVGDLVTVEIYERASAEKEAETATGRSSSASMGIPKFLGYEAALGESNRNLDPTNLISASTDNTFKGSGSTMREEKLSATLTARVVQVEEGGNLRIEGSKTVRVNHEDQIIWLTGVIRPSDITAYNTIDSKYILDARIEYHGDGVISEKQRPGWLVRLIDIVWPF